jgi:DNA-binding MarR family transcriptional regulator
MTAETASEPAGGADEQAGADAPRGFDLPDEDTALQLVLALHRLVRSLRGPLPAAGLHPTQLLLLAQLIEAGPLRIGELAARVPCSQPTATTVANGLEVSGLVRRDRDTTDGRAIRLHITDAGRAAMTDVVRAQAELLRQRLDVLDEPDRDRIEAAVPVLRRMVVG